jgi:hypothetical protein
MKIAKNLKGWGSDRITWKIFTPGGTSFDEQLVKDYPDTRRWEIAEGTHEAVPAHEFMREVEFSIIQSLKK